MAKEDFALSPDSPEIDDLSKAQIPSGMSTGQIVAISGLVLAFFIILGMVIYYWWEVKNSQSAQMLAKEVVQMSPPFAQAVLNGKLDCYGNMPEWKQPKATPLTGASPSAPGLFSGLGGKLSSLTSGLGGKLSSMASGLKSVATMAAGGAAAAGGALAAKVAAVKTAGSQIVSKAAEVSSRKASAVSSMAGLSKVQKTTTTQKVDGGGVKVERKTPAGKLSTTIKQTVIDKARVNASKKPAPAPNKSAADSAKRLKMDAEIAARKNKAATTRPVQPKLSPDAKKTQTDQVLAKSKTNAAALKTKLDSAKTSTKPENAGAKKQADALAAIAQKRTDRLAAADKSRTEATAARQAKIDAKAGQPAPAKELTKGGIVATKTMIPGGKELVKRTPEERAARASAAAAPPVVKPAVPTAAPPVVKPAVPTAAPPVVKPAVPVATPK